MTVTDTKIWNENENDNIEFLNDDIEISRLDVSGYLDEFGDVRVKNLWIADKCILDLNDENDSKKAIELYRRWVQNDEYVCIKRTQELNGKTERDWFAVKAVKRGNDVYSHHAKKRLAELERNLEPYINPDGLHTNLLYVTLTTNPEIYNNDINEAWQRIGSDWNKFLVGLRKAWGKIRIVRSWESFDNGYPHIHSLLAFESNRFVIIPHVAYPKDRPPVKTARIPKAYKDTLAGHWHSFVDVIAVTRDNVRNVMHDVCQYVLKFSKDQDYRNFDNWSSKQKKTLTYLWLNRLRTFSVSRQLLVDGFPEDAENDLTMRIKVIKTMTDIYGNRATVVFELLGMVSGQKAGIESSEWHKSYRKEPDWVRDVWLPRSIRSPGCVGGLGSVFK
jgi:hypothetical protein